MARGKKNEKELTIEERLEQALVPAEEQPYSVPENWCWVTLATVCKNIRAGGDKPKTFSEEKTDKTLIPVVANGIHNEGIIGYTDIASEEGGTVTVAGRGTIGFSLVRNYSYYPVIRLIVIQPYNIVLPTYIKYIFDCFEEKGTGSSIPQLTVPVISTKKIPIAPFAEQQRIVDRIESLFAKLDEAKEKARAVVDGFEARKAAILCMAFTGELTSTWREIHKVSVSREVQEKGLNQHLVPQDAQPFSIPKTWLWVFMGGIGYTNIGLTYKPSEKSLEGTIVLRSCNIQNGRMDYNDIVRVSTDIPENKQCKKGDILICARNGSKSLVGKCAIIDQDGMSYGAFMAIFRSVYNPFIYHYLNSPFFRNIIDQDVGTTTINQVTQALLKKLPFPFAPAEEQEEIVRILDTLLAKEKQAKETAEVVLDQIETMKKSILARAFRGELGTNDPAEESAVGLLKQAL